MVTHLHIATATPDDTRTVAAVVARHLRPGDVVALSGELGAGKTCFVQGAAAELGVTAPVTSPTFVLLHTYPGEVPVVHGDVYRLGTLRDVLDLGEDVFAPDVVTFLEWGDAVRSLLPDDHLEVVLTHAELDAPPSSADADLGEGLEVDVAVAEPRQLALRGHGRHADLPAAVAADLAQTPVGAGVRVRTGTEDPSC